MSANIPYSYLQVSYIFKIKSNTKSRADFSCRYLFGRPRLITDLKRLHIAKFPKWQQRMMPIITSSRLGDCSLPITSEYYKYKSTKCIALIATFLYHLQDQHALNNASLCPTTYADELLLYISTCVQLELTASCHIRPRTACIVARHRHGAQERLL